MHIIFLHKEKYIEHRYSSVVILSIIVLYRYTDHVFLSFGCFSFSFLTTNDEFILEMSARTEPLSETSMLSSSERNRRSIKRFRPSVQCSHRNNQTNEQCTADGFMECVHCDKICCLMHITQHQDELKQIRDRLVEVEFQFTCFFSQKSILSESK